MSDIQADSPVSAPQGPGHALAAARESRGLSIPEIAMRLKFATRQIEALERDQYDLLPGIAITRGMVRGYARLVEIDATPLIAELEQRMQSGPNTVRPADMHVTISEGRKEGRVFLVLSLIVLIVVAAFALEWYVRDRRAAQTLSPSAQGTSTIKPLDPTLQRISTMPSAEPVGTVETAPADDALMPDVVPVPDVEATLQAETPAPSIALDEPAPQDQAKPLQMRFSDAVWVEVKDARGRVLISRIADAATQLALDGPAPLSVVIGNPAAVELTYEGEPVDLSQHARAGVARLKLE